MIPLQGVCQVSQLFQGNIFHFSMGAGRSAATRDLLSDYRQPPTVHKPKHQRPDFPSQDNKDLPRGSKFPTFSEQIFQMNHLIKHTENLFMEMSFYQIITEYKLVTIKIIYKSANYEIPHAHP